MASRSFQAFRAVRMKSLLNRGEQDYHAIVEKLHLNLARFLTAAQRVVDEVVDQCDVRRAFEKVSPSHRWNANGIDL